MVTADSTPHSFFFRTLLLLNANLRFLPGGSPPFLIAFFGPQPRLLRLLFPTVLLESLAEAEASEVAIGRAGTGILATNFQIVGPVEQKNTGGGLVDFLTAGASSRHETFHEIVLADAQSSQSGFQGLVSGIVIHRAKCGPFGMADAENIAADSRFAGQDRRLPEEFDRFFRWTPIDFRVKILQIFSKFVRMSETIFRIRPWIAGEGNRLDGGKVPNWSVFTVGFALILGVGTLPAQDTGVDPAAASGMTQGLPGVSTQRQAELMHVRARAQAARPDAERAAMERSAEAAIEERTQQAILEDARETKRLKEQAARDMQMQRAANAYQGVSRREMSSWADNSGRVKIDGGIPPEVLAALPPEEVVEEKKKFGFLGMPVRAAKGAAGATVGAAKKTVSIIPGVGKKKEPAPEATSAYVDPSQYYSQEPVTEELYDPNNYYEEEEKKGFFRKVGSSLPFVGSKDDGDLYASGDFISPEPAPVVVGTPNSAAAPSAAAPAPTPVMYDSPGGGSGNGQPPGGGASMAQSEYDPYAEPEKEGFFKKLPLIGGRNNEPVVDEVAPPEPYMVADTSASADSFPVAQEKEGIGGKLKNFAGKVIPGGGNSGGGMAGGDGSIDASLFPQEGDPEELMADTSGLRPKFFKKPNLELPQISLPGSAEPELPKPETPVAKKPRTPNHSGGNAYYLVQTNGAQFMRFASDTLGSESMTLSAGTRVRKTKVGDEWSTIQLSTGATGIIRNDDLRPDDGSGVRSATASAAPVPTVPTLPNRGGLATTSSGGARITAPVSATGAGVSDVPGPPVTMPESSLPESAVGSLE